MFVCSSYNTYIVVSASFEWQTYHAIINIVNKNVYSSLNSSLHVTSYLPSQMEEHIGILFQIHHCLIHAGFERAMLVGCQQLISQMERHNFKFIVLTMEEKSSVDGSEI
jgi:hypothetical protein